MAHRNVLLMAYLVTLLAMTSSAKEDQKNQSRWSRQISSYTADISDWVPLSKPVEEPTRSPQMKRQAIAEPRILSEPFPALTRSTGLGHEPFPPRNYFNSATNRQLYLQSVPAVPSAPQNFLSEQGFGQSIRFGLSQPNLPLTQGFVAPPFTFESAPTPPKPSTQIVPSNSIRFPQNNGAISTQAKPFENQGLPNHDSQKFVDGYKAENASSDFTYNTRRKPQSLQKIKFENVDKTPRAETVSQNTKVEREEVQLLYVPVESLNRGQFNFRSPLASPQILNSELYSHGIQKPNPPKQTFINNSQRPGLGAVGNFQGQNYFSEFSSQLRNVDQVPKFSTISSPSPIISPTTPQPKKLKPHQPPLAIFMTKETAKNNQVKVGDVLSSLKNSETIAVLDSVNPINAPKVFIGPSNLPPPQNFVKFELPYLSNIENSEKKLQQLPFFVAPLSYNTPPGFAKIPFPSPHVGSVVINSLIRDNSQTQSPTRPNILPNPYISNTYTTNPPIHKLEQKPIQKTSFTFFNTDNPQEKPLSNFQSNYYSFEPQSVSSIRPTKQPEIATPKTGSYFLSNIGSQYNSNEYQNYPQQENSKSAEAIDFRPSTFNNPIKLESTTRKTTQTTSKTTPKIPSTFPNQLLETHNPYSINQAFHFSTPLDYHNYFDELKQPYVTPGNIRTSPLSQTPRTESSISTSTPSLKTEEETTEKPKIQQQSTPLYIQNYSPEIHYNSKEEGWRVFNPNELIETTEPTTPQTRSNYPENSDVNPTINGFSTEYLNQNIETRPPADQENLKEVKLPSVPEAETAGKYEYYNQFENSYETTENPTLISTTTTTTRRVPTRHRGHPRYTTTIRPESYDSTTKIVTRKPLRERRPQPTKSRYEQNKIATDKLNNKPFDTEENTTKSTRTRSRGRIQFRPSGNDEIYDRRVKSHSNEGDLAYQRDVLHQNYPVTLMERASTLDVEAITEPTPRLSFTKIQEPVTEAADTENAYTNEKLAISQNVAETQPKQKQTVQTFTSRTTINEDSSYISRLPSIHKEEYIFQPRNTVASSQVPSYDINSEQEEEDIYVKHTKPELKSVKSESNSYVTESGTISQPDVPNNLVNDEMSTIRQEETTTYFEDDLTKNIGQENHTTEEEDIVVQTTPSYNRVRVRPGVVRQYHQASSESPRTKERRRHQSVTYRPAFDRRKTTMKIEEIEADLKTKPVHSRNDFQDHKHPVYRPDPTNEIHAISSTTTEITTKRGHFRRRRPSYSYSTTSTEIPSSTKRIYDIKNRFRGRRPTETPTEKPESQTEGTTSTVKSHTRYIHRPRLSERYNKKPESETEMEDQQPNSSINIMKYVEPNSDQWSPKISSESFKPYNPNNLVKEHKVATTERRSDKESVLDIITARNEYDDILISVTPASNKLNKKLPDVPATLEAFVEQTKVTKGESGDGASTFESMLEEVMKSLEEQDQDEYSTTVMKHKGGEIGEIPPERIISSDDNIQKSTTLIQQENTTTEPVTDDSELSKEDDNNKHRRGFWKKTKVRPAESIEFAESQFYTNAVNRFGEPLKVSKTSHDKHGMDEKIKVTTYKPKFDFIKDILDKDYDTLPNIDDLSNVDIQKINNKSDDNEETLINEESQHTTVYVQKHPQTDKTISPGDLDLGTGSPDPTLDSIYLTTEAATAKSTIVDRSNGYSFIDYLFGVTSEDSERVTKKKNKLRKNTTESEINTSTEQFKSKIVTTETTFIPEEITDLTISNEMTENNSQFYDIKRSDIDERDTSDEVTEISVVKVESSSTSSFMNPANVVSTSMSTEVSHETEICFRGKCIKTNKNIL